MDLYANEKVRERAYVIVSQDVIYCVSLLISALAQASAAGHVEDLDYENDLMPLLEGQDWEEAAEQHLQDLDAEGLVGVLELGGVQVEAELRAKARLMVEEMGAKEFCEEHSIDPERREIFEHWIVSAWLSGKLEEQGEAVGEVLGLTVWGRPTTGQSISMDNVILQIAANQIGDSE